MCTHSRAMLCMYSTHKEDTAELCYLCKDKIREEATSVIIQYEEVNNVHYTDGNQALQKERQRKQEKIVKARRKARFNKISLIK